jgi:hypothetical protein
MKPDHLINRDHHVDIFHINLIRTQGEDQSTNPSKIYLPQ